MKTKNEASRFLALGEQTCNILRVAYPDYEIAVEYDNQEEQLIFSIDAHTYKVNVRWDSVCAGVVDIAKQLLSKPLYDYI